MPLDNLREDAKLMLKKLEDERVFLIPMSNLTDEGVIKVKDFVRINSIRSLHSAHIFSEMMLIHSILAFRLAKSYWTNGWTSSWAQSSKTMFWKGNCVSSIGFCPPPPIVTNSIQQVWHANCNTSYTNLVLTRLHVAVPTPRDDKQRNPVIPSSVFRGRRRTTAEDDMER